MFKKPFNYKTGEVRVCKGCGNEYHTDKPRWHCVDCLNEAQKKYQCKYVRKEQYPFDNRTGESNRRFCSIRTALSNAWKEYRKTGDRSIITKHYNKQLEEIRENGIMTWILDRRTLEAKQENSPKTRNRIRKDYPDLRGYHEY
jgi:hypothetical protein